MNFKTRLKLLLSRETKFPTATKHITKYAFTVDGIEYKEFDTPANIPAMRGLKFLSVYNECDMRCDRFYLNALSDAIEAQFNKPKLGFTEMNNIRTWNAQLKERLTWVYSEDLIYKLASVFFFDASENPNDWEWKHALEKIELWKKKMTFWEFISNEPIQRLIPYLKDFGANSMSYSQTQKEKDLAQLENLLANLSGSLKKDLPSYTERYFSEEMKRSSH